VLLDNSGSQGRVVRVTSGIGGCFRSANIRSETVRIDCLPYEPARRTPAGSSGAPRLAAHEALRVDIRSTRSPEWTPRRLDMQVTVRMLAVAGASSALDSVSVPHRNHQRRCARRRSVAGASVMERIGTSAMFTTVNGWQIAVRAHVRGLVEASPACAELSGGQANRASCCGLCRGRRAVVP
jgi:hypothetical protein